LIADVHGEEAMQKGVSESEHEERGERGREGGREGRREGQGDTHLYLTIVPRYGQALRVHLGAETDAFDDRIVHVLL